MSVQIFLFDVSNRLTASHKSKLFKEIDGCVLEFKIDDKAHAALKACKDSAIDLKRLVGLTSRACLLAGSALAKSFEGLEKKVEAAKPDARGALVKGFIKEVEGQLGKLRGELKDLAEKHWRTYLDKASNVDPKLKSAHIDAEFETNLGGIGKLTAEEIEEDEKRSAGGAKAVKLDGTISVPGGASNAKGFELAVRVAARHVKTLRNLAVENDKLRVKTFAELKVFVLEFMKQQKQAHATNDAKIIEQAIITGVHAKRVEAVLVEARLWAAKYKAETKFTKAVNDLLAQAQIKNEEIDDAIEKLDEDNDKGGGIKKVKKAVDEVQKQLESLTKEYEESTAKLKATKQAFLRVEAMLLPLAERDPISVLQRFDQNYRKILKLMIDISKTTQLRLKSSTVELKSIDKLVKNAVVLSKAMK